MNKKVLLFILVGIFIGIFISSFLYEKIDEKNHTEKILSWDIYKEYIDVVETFVSSYNPNTLYYGIYNDEEVTLVNLSKNDKAVIIYNYLDNKKLIKDSFIKNNDYKNISKLIFNEQILFDKVSIDKNFVFKKDNSRNGYALEHKDVELDRNYYILNKGIKGAYQYDDSIYFDIKVTFVEYDINSKTYSYSLYPKFDKVFCSGNKCDKKMKSVIYRILFREKDGKYYFESSKRMGSE